MTRSLLWLFALSCAIAVANLYYAQPLIVLIGSELKLSHGQSGALVTATQVGYALGLSLIVPLGDTLPRRPLVLGLFVVDILALVLTGLAHSGTQIMLAAFAIGLCSCSVQVLVPLAATLAQAHQRGMVVGRVMAGLLVGILLARTVAGAIAGPFGWRPVYFLAAAAMAMLALWLWKMLPAGPPPRRVAYRTLLASLVTLVGNDALLRRRSLLGGLAFASFSVLWTGLTFLLSAAPYGFNPAHIGLFGLAGAAGAIAATRAGRLADAGLSRPASLAFAVVILASWVGLASARASLVLLIAAIVALDVGVQGLHILNQSLIYAGESDARSRITTVYLTTYFIGGALGSLAASLSWQAFGWSAVCAIGALFALAIVVLCCRPGPPLRSHAAPAP